MGKMWRISNNFSSEASGPMSRGLKDSKNGHGPLTKMAAYMVKTFKNLLLRGCLGAESLHMSSEMGGLLKFLKC